jgi:hypothetical protein
MCATTPAGSACLLACTPRVCVRPDTHACILPSLYPHVHVYCLFGSRAHAVVMPWLHGRWCVCTCVPFYERGVRARPLCFGEAPCLIVTLGAGRLWVTGTTAVASRCPPFCLCVQGVCLCLCATAFSSLPLLLLCCAVLGSLTQLLCNCLLFLHKNIHEMMEDWVDAQLCLWPASRAPSAEGDPRKMSSSSSLLKRTQQALQPHQTSAVLCHSSHPRLQAAPIVQRAQQQ